jgi:hypothetical protein
MRTMIVGSAVLALLSADVCAQGMDNKPSAPSNAAASKKTAQRPKAAQAPAGPSTTSKITFHSHPSGAKITLSNGKSCIAPCSFIVGFNEKFTAVGTKPGYRPKEILVAPSLTDLGKAQVIGTAIGAGVIGLVVGAAIADRAYGPEPFVVELTPDPTGAAVASRPAKPEGAKPKPSTDAPKSASALPSAPAAPKTTTSAAEPKPAAAPRPPAAAANAVTRPAPAQVVCDRAGCAPIKAGCRVVEPDRASSSNIGGQNNTVVCR